MLEAPVFKSLSIIGTCTDSMPCSTPLAENELIHDLVCSDKSPAMCEQHTRHLQRLLKTNLKVEKRPGKLV